jgi:agmatinase
LLPYVGIPSFARAPIIALDSEWKADVAVLGIPSDLALGYRPGARFAPRALRAASLRYSLAREGFYDLRADRVRLEGLEFYDVGDVDLPSLEPQLSRERIENAARQLRARARLPIFIGGDHSVSYPVLRAFRDVVDLHVVQIDAHLDFTDERDGTRYSNSSTFRRVKEDLTSLGGITTLGLRGLRFDREAVEAARHCGHTLVPMWELHEQDEVAAKLPRGRSVYLSFDVDALDPSIFPATSSPEVDGMTYRQATDVIRMVGERNTIIGFDLVEMTPELDTSGNSALLASRLVLETIMAVFP